MRSKLLILPLLALVMAGCASGPGGIYAPAGGQSAPRTPETAPEPPRSAGEEEERRTERLSEQPPRQEPSQQPSYRQQGDDLSAAARSLIDQADQLLAQGNAAGAVSQLERAQRISPRSAEVYYKLSEAYVATGNLGAAEQFTLKGLSLTGSDARLQKAGWNLLADIRRARGNVAGADQAEQRAQAL